MAEKPTLRQRARALRGEATPAEKIMWSIVRDRRFDGFKFRRQQIIGPYIVDFFCAEARVVVELDGESHVGKDEHDEARSGWLQTQRLKVLRFWNTDVYEDKEAVLESIWRACTSEQLR